MVHLATATQAALLLISLVLTALILSRVPDDGSYLQAKKSCHLNSGNSIHNEDTCLQNWCVNESGWPTAIFQDADSSKQGYDPDYNRFFLNPVDFTDSSSYKLAIVAAILICGAAVIQFGIHLQSFCKSSRQLEQIISSRKKWILSVTHTVAIWTFLVASLALLSFGEAVSHKPWGLYNTSLTIWIAACAVICAASVACVATPFLFKTPKLALPKVSQEHSGAISTDSEQSPVSLKSVWEVMFARAEIFRLDANPSSGCNQIDTGVRRPDVLYRPFSPGEEGKLPIVGDILAARMTLNRPSVEKGKISTDTDLRSVDRNDLRGGREAQGVRQFSSDELYTATSGDSALNILGMGGCGTVYKGCLPDGTCVAVKKLNPGLGSKKSAEGLMQLAVEVKEFPRLVETISSIHHRNLVRLVGFSVSSSQEMALAYEFMENGSLDDHLRGKKGNGLDWPTRKRIAVGTARGLAYLHYDCSPRIVHRDVKAQNLLLDIDFNAKVADFGLARMLGAKADHCSTKVMGTYGYLAPDVVHTGHVTDKADVYSFGVVLLELLTGRKPLAPPSPLTDKPISLVEWARDEWQRKVDPMSLVDPTLSDVVLDEVEAIWTIAIECIHYKPERRPAMDQVLRRLQETLERKLAGLSNVEYEVDEAPSVLNLRTIAFGDLSTGSVEALLTEKKQHLGSKRSTTTKSPQAEEGEILV